MPIFPQSPANLVAFPVCFMKDANENEKWVKKNNNKNVNSIVTFQDFLFADFFLSVI